MQAMHPGGWHIKSSCSSRSVDLARPLSCLCAYAMQSRTGTSVRGITLRGLRKLEGKVKELCASGKLGEDYHRLTTRQFVEG